MKKHEQEHGTTRSYVIGYILSLIFTFIPYFMVVDKWMTGRSLLLAILGIGVLQMVIQLLFFLHLGRGPKPLYNVVFFFATAGAIIVVIGASLIIMDNLYRNMSPQELTTRIAQEENIAQLGGQETGACNVNNKSYIVSIKDLEIMPLFVQAKRCDTLTLINDGEHTLSIRFGTPEEEVSYGGQYEITVRPDRPETITLNEVGEFTYYNFFDPSVIGHFIVSEQ